MSARIHMDSNSGRNPISNPNSRIPTISLVIFRYFAKVLRKFDGLKSKALRPMEKPQGGR